MDHNKIKGTGLTVLQFSILLIMASSIVRLASSLYLPSLVQIGKSLNLSDASLSSTLTIFFVAFAASTLFAGPLADAIGRKKIIITGLLIFVLGSALCGMAEGICMLMIGRVLQAAGASCIPVAGRAMIRDVCSDIQVMEVLGWMAALGGLVPIIAPVIGGTITDTIGWRYNFWLLVVAGFFSGSIICLKLPVTLPEDTDRTLHIGKILSKYRQMLLSPKLTLVIIPLALAFAIQGAYLAASPFIFIKRFGLSPTMFGVSNLAVVSSMLAGRYIATGLIRISSIFYAYMAGALITFAGCLSLSIVCFTGMASITTVLITLAIAVTGFGTLLPIAVKSIMTAFRHQAGIASALHGCITLGSAALGSLSISIFQKHKISHLDSMCYFILPVGLIIFISSFFSRKHLK